jgi:hypothetical protein
MLAIRSNCAVKDIVLIMLRQSAFIEVNQAGSAALNADSSDGIDLLKSQKSLQRIDLLKQ